MKKYLFLWIVAFVCAVNTVSSQTMALKTNLLYDATTTPNLGMELSVGKKSSLQLFYGWNPWKFSDTKKLRHWSLMPEYRYWFCSPMSGHFVGVHALGGQYNVAGIKIPMVFNDADEYRYEGWYAGGGITYGYSWILGKHWNFEAAVGVGYAYLDYKKFKCQTCGVEVSRGHKNYVGLTKAALSLVYVF